jgi:hypothetical protein
MWRLDHKKFTLLARSRGTHLTAQVHELTHVNPEVSSHVFCVSPLWQGPMIHRFHSPHPSQHLAHSFGVGKKVLGYCLRSRPCSRWQNNNGQGLDWGFQLGCQLFPRDYRMWTYVNCDVIVFWNLKTLDIDLRDGAAGIFLSWIKLDHQSLLAQTPGVKLNHDDENHDDLERDAIFLQPCVSNQKSMHAFLFFSNTTSLCPSVLSVCQKRVGVEGFINASKYSVVMQSIRYHHHTHPHTFPAPTKRSPRSGGNAAEREVERHLQRKRTLPECLRSYCHINSNILNMI